MPLELSAKEQVKGADRANLRELSAKAGWQLCKGNLAELQIGA
jgi:hypothetical protein